MLSVRAPSTPHTRYCTVHSFTDQDKSSFITFYLLLSIINVNILDPHTVPCKIQKKSIVS